MLGKFLRSFAFLPLGHAYCSGFVLVGAPARARPIMGHISVVSSLSTFSQWCHFVYNGTILPRKTKTKPTVC